MAQVKGVEVGGWTLRPSMREKMVKLAQKSSDDGLEYGFALCMDPAGTLVEGSGCEGDKCSIDLDASKCPTNTVQVGDFHTHPNGVPVPSTGDMFVWLQNREKWNGAHVVGCIGAADVQGRDLLQSELNLKLKPRGGLYCYQADKDTWKSTFNNLFWLIYDGANRFGISYNEMARSTDHSRPYDDTLKAHRAWRIDQDRAREVSPMGLLDYFGIWDLGTRVEREGQKAPEAGL